MTGLSDISKNPNRYFTVKEVSDALIVHKSTVFEWIRKGLLKAEKEPHFRYIRGYVWKIKGKDVLDYLVKAGEEARAEYQKELLDV